jgi:putative ABC transport system ATP-binding protein/macrolide transport system ATP-binding/permease protein/lipoprotein-releasing system ATP-binding protein
MILWAQSLTKRYGADPGYDAVCGASLEVKTGEFISIVGRSGSGKSTLLAMLGGLTKPNSGLLSRDGRDLWTLPEKRLAAFRCREIGFVFQFPSLLPNLSTADNVALPAVLGHTMPAAEAYARSHALLARVGLSDRAEAYPDALSGGEQRRLAIARALINTPALLLADEPTSDLDEDSEADIIDLLEQLQRSDGFGFVLVTHNLDIAGRAERSYVMRNGVLATAGLAKVRPAEPRPRRFGPAPMPAIPEPPVAGPGERVRLGRDLRSSVRALFLVGAAITAAFLLLDLSVEKYQEAQLRAHSRRVAALQAAALDRLRSEIRSIADLGDGQYEMTIALSNIGDGQPVFVTSPEIRGYVQVGKLWQEVPLEPYSEDADKVLKIESQRIYRYSFAARVRDFTQLFPNYMHVRFSGTMLVGLSAASKDDVFERKDNYYVYLKPFDVADGTILKRMKFAGKPPVWIPMPPH